MKNIFKILAVAIFAIGLVYTAWALLPGRDLRTTYQSTVQLDGKILVTSESVRINKANGDWQEHQTYYQKDGTLDHEATVIAIGGVGVFRMLPKTQELLYLGPRPAGYKPPFDLDKVKQSSNYAGEDTIAGEPAVKIAKPNNIQYYSINHPGLLLADDANGELRRAVNIETGSFKLDALPDWPINYTSFQRKVAAVSAGNPKLGAEIDAGRPK